MNSIEIDYRGFLGTRSGCNKPYGRCCGAFACGHISHMQMNFFINFHMCGHQKSLEISSMLLLTPKYPRDGRL
jgi:hypothetical protein